MTDTQLHPSTFGVWLRGLGWWKLPHPETKAYEAYKTLIEAEARTYARLIGGEVRPIDRQLEVGEEDILKSERTFLGWLKGK